MATSRLSVSASPLTAIPSSSLPKLCRPYALLVSARPRPPQVICKRSALVHQHSFGLRRTCHLTGNDPNSKRFYGFRIKVEPQSGSGETAVPPGGSGGTAADGPAPQDLKKKKKEEFETEEKLAVSLAKYVADLSEKCIKEKGFFNVVFSGGSLIQSLRKLLEPPYDKKVEWSKWRVFWVDERVVPRDHIDSNYRVAYDNFLSRVPILLRNVYAINDAVLDEAAAEDYEGRLKRLVNTRALETSSETEFPKFDLVLLGMGSDGHVGSLFPGHALLNENKSWVAYMDNSPKEPRKRITMTLPVINACDHVALVVCGGAQAEAVAKGWAQTPTAVLPAQKISPEKEFFWFLDKDAASKLEKKPDQS